MVSTAIETTDPYTGDGVRDLFVNAGSENGDMGRGGIAPNKHGLKREDHWIVELFGPSDSEFSEHENEVQVEQPMQIRTEVSIVTELQPQRGVEAPLPFKASNFKGVHESSTNHSLSRKDGPQKQPRLIFDCVEIPLRHSSRSPSTLPTTNANRYVSQDPYAEKGVRDSLFDAESENGGTERGGITPDRPGLDREDHWLVELFGPSDNEFSEHENEAGQPAQTTTGVSIVTELQPQRGVEASLSSKANHFKGVHGSSTNNSVSIKGGPQRQPRLVFDCVEIPLRHSPSIPSTLPKTNANRDVSRRSTHNRLARTELFTEDDEDTDSTDSAYSEGSAEAPAAKARLLNEEELRFLLSPLTSISTPPTRVAAYFDRIASLRYGPETGLYTFRGLCCQHDTTSSAAPQSGSKTKNCAALEAFHLYWCPELLSIVDTTNKSIILGRDIQKTLAKATRGTSIDLGSLIHHLYNVYPINTSETNLDLDKRFAEIVLKELIPGLDPPILRHQCNLCQKWVPNIARHRYDIKMGRFKSHSLDPVSDSVTQRYFILPLKSGGSSAALSFQKSLKVILAPDFIPDSDSERKYSDLPQNIPAASSLEHSVPTPNLIIPVYVYRLGWLEYLRKVKDSPQTFLDVKSLAARSSKHRRLFKNGMPGSVVESFLLLLPALIKQYFTEAERRISTSHSSVRELVTAAAKGSFRSLSDHTLKEYAAVVTNSIAFALRWVSLQRNDSSKVQHFTRMGCEPRWKADQLKITLSFLDQLLTKSPRHDIDDQNNQTNEGVYSLGLEYIHKFLVFALTSPFSDGGSVDSIIEQTILFASFNLTKGWRNASEVINGPLKALQYISRVVSVHCAFLGNTSLTYVPLIGDKETLPLLSNNSRIDNNSGNSDESDDRNLEDGNSDDSDSDDSDSDDSYSSDSSTLMELIDFSAIASIGTAPPTSGGHGSNSEETEHLLRFFTNEAKVFKARNLTYQWGRCSAIWSILLSQSKTESSATAVDWSPDGRTLTFQSSYCTVNIGVEAFRLSVIELPKFIWQLFLQLFPEGFPQEQLRRLEDLKVSLFNDDPDSPDSLFDRKDNIDIFYPYRSALQAMLRSEKPIHKQYNDALSRFQTALVHGIIACNGVSMRSCQAAQLRLSASEGLPRNIYIDSTQCYIGKPKSKQRYSGLSHYEAYWLLDDKVGLAILLYSGIFRPLEPTLLLQHNLKSQQTSESLASGTSFLFVKVLSLPRRRELVGWDGRDINKALRAEGSPLRAEGRVYRHFTKALFRKYLTIQAIQISQENSSPGRQVPLPNLRQEQRDSVLGRKMQLAFSVSVHQLLGLKILLSPTLDSTFILYRDHALQLARHLVRHHYQLSGNAQADIQEKVQRLLSTLPFMYGNDRDSISNAEWQTLGDRTLIEVTAAAAYGPTQPSLMENMPYDGYPTSIVAAALGTIWASIEEWRTASYCPQQFSRESSQAVENKFTEKLIVFRHEQRPAWLKFCFEVHQHATRSLRFVDHYPLPHIVPQVKLLPLDTSFQAQTYAEIPILKRQAMSCTANCSRCSGHGGGCGGG